MDYTCFSE